MGLERMTDAKKKYIELLNDKHEKLKKQLDQRNEQDEKKKSKEEEEEKADLKSFWLLYYEFINLEFNEDEFYSRFEGYDIKEIKKNKTIVKNALTELLKDYK